MKAGQIKEARIVNEANRFTIDELEELRLIDDINRLSIDELEEIYLKTKESFVDFVQKYTKMFSERLSYQVRAVDKYETVYTLLSDGLVEYPDTKQEVVDKIATLINTMAFVREQYEVGITPGGNYKKADDKEQAHDILKTQLGMDGLRHTHYNYEKAVQDLAAGCEAYANRDDAFEMDFYRRQITSTLNSTNDPVEIKRAIDGYKSEHPFCKQCNKMSFLFYVNYMINNNPSMVDEELLTLAEQVIEMSDITKDLDGVSKEQYQDYKKLAAYTKQCITDYRKKQKQDVTKEQSMQRNKLKQLFARKNI